MDIQLSTRTQAILVAYKRGYRVVDNKVLSPNKKERTLTNHHGYSSFCITFGGKSVQVAVHRLAAYQKFGDLLLAAECVRHLDGNPSNNRLENLEIGTNSDNMMDIPKEKRKQHAKRASSFLIKYDKDSVIEFYNKTKSYKETMKHFGITSKGTLYAIIHRK